MENKMDNQTMAKFMALNTAKDIKGIGELVRMLTGIIKDDDVIMLATARIRLKALIIFSKRSLKIVDGMLKDYPTVIASVDGMINEYLTNSASAVVGAGEHGTYEVSEKYKKEDLKTDSEKENEEEK